MKYPQTLFHGAKRIPISRRSPITHHALRITHYPKVSIIILNWNGLEDTVECLESLKKISYPNYEVIVVDNGSEGDDAQVLKKRFADCIHLIENDRNYGFAGGANIGMRYALNNYSPEYLLLLNNDTVVAPGFLNQLIKLAESDASIGIVGPKVYKYNSANCIDSIGARLNMWTGQVDFLAYTHIDTGQYDDQLEVDWVGPCILMKSGMVQNIGLYDESYFFYWEDVDYCIRAKKAGYKVMFLPEAKIWHKRGKSSEKMASGSLDYYSTRNRIRFMKKHASRCQYLTFLVYLFGWHLWLTSASLVYLWKTKQLAAFYRGVKDGLFDYCSGSRLYE